jgi:hypothetical protein
MDEREHPTSPGSIIDERLRRGEKLNWLPSPEDEAFPVWVMEEIRRQHGGRYSSHPPYTDVGIELLEALSMWPWRPAVDPRTQPIQKQTVNCVRCMKPANTFSGHVIMGREKVHAAWCSDECRKAISEVVSPSGMGCMGQWHAGLGLQGREANTF